MVTSESGWEVPLAGGELDSGVGEAFAVATVTPAVTVAVTETVVCARMVVVEPASCAGVSAGAVFR
jgi:hypothetical protein